MNDREKWGERVRDIRAGGTTWWWWWWWCENSIKNQHPFILRTSPNWLTCYKISAIAIKNQSKLNPFKININSSFLCFLSHWLMFGQGSAIIHFWFWSIFITLRPFSNMLSWVSSDGIGANMLTCDIVVKFRTSVILSHSFLDLQKVSTLWWLTYFI